MKVKHGGSVVQRFELRHLPIVCVAETERTRGSDFQKKII